MTALDTLRHSCIFQVRNQGILGKRFDVVLNVHTNKITGYAFDLYDTTLSYNQFNISLDLVCGVKKTVIKGKESIVIEYRDSSLVSSGSTKKIVLWGISDSQRWETILNRSLQEYLDDARKIREEENKQSGQKNEQPEQKSAEELLKEHITALAKELSFAADSPKYASIIQDIQACITQLRKLRDYEVPVAGVMSADDSLLEFELDYEGKSYVAAKYIGFDDETIQVPATYRGKPVTRIGTGAFKDCKSLKHISLGDNVTVLESSAFEGCINLQNVSNVRQVKYVGKKAFLSCRSLTAITFSSQLKYVEYEVFSNSGLESFCVPPCVKYLGGKLFYGCKNLKTVQLTNGVQAIGKSCFAECRQLSTIEIPASVMYVGREAFCNCVALKNLVVKSHNTEWKEEVFTTTRIWRPDLRYNPRTIYSNLPDINIECYAGATIQSYAREHNLKCSRLTGIPEKAPNVEFSLNTVIGIQIWEITKPRSEEHRLLSFLSHYDTVITTEYFSFEGSTTPPSKHTDAWLLDGGIVKLDALWSWLGYNQGGYHQYFKSQYDFTSSRCIKLSRLLEGW